MRGARGAFGGLAGRSGTGATGATAAGAGSGSGWSAGDETSGERVVTGAGGAGTLASAIGDGAAVLGFAAGLVTLALDAAGLGGSVFGTARATTAFGAAGLSAVAFAAADFAAGVLGGILGVAALATLALPAGFEPVAFTAFLGAALLGTGFGAALATGRAAGGRTGLPAAALAAGLRAGWPLAAAFPLAGNLLPAVRGGADTADFAETGRFDALRAAEGDGAAAGLRVGALAAGTLAAFFTGASFVGAGRAFCVLRPGAAPAFDLTLAFAALTAAGLETGALAGRGRLAGLAGTATFTRCPRARLGSGRTGLAFVDGRALAFVAGRCATAAFAAGFALGAAFGTGLAVGRRAFGRAAGSAAALALVRAALAGAAGLGAGFTRLSGFAGAAALALLFAIHAILPIAASPLAPARHACPSVALPPNVRKPAMPMPSLVGRALGTATDLACGRLNPLAALGARRNEADVPAPPIAWRSGPAVLTVSNPDVLMARLNVAALPPTTRMRA